MRFWIWGAICLTALIGCGGGKGSGATDAGATAGQSGKGGSIGTGGNVGGAGGSAGAGGHAGAGGAGQGGTSAGTAGAGGVGGSCPAVTACGGSLLGTWKIVSTCFAAMAQGSASCASETIGVTGFEETGTYVFNSDLTYSASVNPTGELDLTIPASCVPAQPIATTCATFNATYAGLVSPGSPYASAGCAVTGTDCRCIFTFNGQPISVTGTYAVSGTGVTLTPSGAAASTDSFCVQGTTLTLETASTTLAVPGQAVLSKQP